MRQKWGAVGGLIAGHLTKTVLDWLGALQEVDFKTKRSWKIDLVTELGFRTQMLPLFGKVMDYDGGAYGEGILTKNPYLSDHCPYLVVLELMPD